MDERRKNRKMDGSLIRIQDWQAEKIYRKSKFKEEAKEYRKNGNEKDRDKREWD